MHRTLPSSIIERSSSTASTSMNPADETPVRRGGTRLIAYVLPCALALAACGPEGPNGTGTGEARPLPSPPPTISTSVTIERTADEDLPVDAGVGLEFDPVTGRLIIPEAGPPPPRPLR